MPQDPARVNDEPAEALRQILEAIGGRGDLSLTAQVVDHAVFVLAPDGRALTWNAGVRQVFGYDAAAFVGLPTAALCTEEDQRRGVPGEHRTQAAEHGSEPLDRLMRRQDGSHFWASGSTTAIRDRAGDVVGYLTILRDISVEKEAEERPHEAPKMDALGRLAGGVAHEINNMMTVVQGYAEVILALPSRDARTVEAIEQIQTAAHRATEVTRQLLAYGQRQVLQPESLQPNETVQALQSVLRQVLGEEVNLRLDLGHGVGRIHADRGQLEQVLVHLLLNARDALPQGGKVTVRSRVVVLTAAEMPREIAKGRRPGRYVVLSVADTGRGMDAGTVQQAFEPFFTTKPLGSGHGLGLPSVQGIVEQMGGFVRLQSAIDRGTVLRLFFPEVEPAAGTSAQEDLARLPLAPEARIPADTTATTQPRLHGTVLVVEDEAMVRGLMVQQLEQRGLTVLQASHGKDALRKLLDVGEVDLVVTDLAMPEMGGRELADVLSQQRPGLPVLFMSAYSEDEMLRRGLMEPGTPFLQKPFQFAELVAKAEALMRRQA